MAVSQNKVVTTQSVKTAVAICTAAKTTLNDATNSVLLLTAGADGALVKKITATPRATVTATQLQLYLSKDSGTTLHLIDSALMAAHTIANTTEAVTTDFGYSATNLLRLAGSDRLYVGAAVALAGGIVFYAEYEDF
jgi:hypothetical protein